MENLKDSRQLYKVVSRIGGYVFSQEHCEIKEPLIKDRYIQNRENFLEGGLEKFQNVIDALESLEPLSDRKLYAYTDYEIKDLLVLVKRVIKDTEKRLNRKDWFQKPHR